MEPLHILELKYTYSIAGLRVLTNRPARVGQVYTGTDGEVKVVFVEKAANHTELVRMLETAVCQDEWVPWIDRNGIAVISSRDGEIVLVRDRDDLIKDHAAFLRQVIPFAAALQNKLVLHASAVRSKERVIAFIGASGAGKSTLAGQFHDRGFLPVADDLLPVHVGSQGAMIRLAEGTKSSPRRVHLASIYFLSRDASLERMQIRALNRMEHLLLHLRNGYSELSIAELWRTQFRSCSKIIDFVEAFQLTLPDDINYLPEAVNMLCDKLLAAREPLNIQTLSSQAERARS